MSRLELEAGQLEHHNVNGGMTKKVERWRSDISANANASAIRAQHIADQGGDRCLAVRAGDRNYRCRVGSSKKLNVTQYFDISRFGFAKNGLAHRDPGADHK